MKKRLKTIFFSFLLFGLLFFSSVNQLLARSGCCSWHGGVCGCDTSVGRQVCCDGLYSPSCTCAYRPPAKPKEIFRNVHASWKYIPNKTKGFTLKVKLDEKEAGAQYSAVLSKCKGCDPGPKADFYSETFTFHNVKPGVWYLNTKQKKTNTQWSNILYYTIEVPEWWMPTPKPTFTPKVEKNLNHYEDRSGKSDNSLIWLVLASIIVLYLFSVSGGNKRK